MDAEPPTLPGLPLPDRLTQDVSVLGVCRIHCTSPSNVISLTSCSARQTRTEPDPRNDEDTVRDVQTRSPVPLLLF